MIIIALLCSQISFALPQTSSLVLVKHHNENSESCLYLIRNIGTGNLPSSNGKSYTKTQLSNLYAKPGFDLPYPALDLAVPSMILNGTMLVLIRMQIKQLILPATIVASIVSAAQLGYGFYFWNGRFKNKIAIEKAPTLPFSKDWATHRTIYRKTRIKAPIAKLTFDKILSQPGEGKRNCNDLEDLPSIYWN